MNVTWPRRDGKPSAKQRPKLLREGALQEEVQTGFGGGIAKWTTFTNLASFSHRPFTCLKSIFQNKPGKNFNFLRDCCFLDKFVIRPHNPTFVKKLVERIHQINAMRGTFPRSRVTARGRTKVSQTR